jgi:hypothetical protein
MKHLIGRFNIRTTTLSSSSPESTHTPDRRSPHLLTLLAAAIVASLLLWFARLGLFVYLTGDDMMNIYKAWREPYYRILLENLAYFTPAYRPMGSLVYRLLFDLAGVHALPFRIVCFALMLANLYLLYRTAAAISTKETGLLTALFGSYNAAFIDLYYNTGTIYDLLCFTFYFLALGLYVKVRKAGQYLKPRTLISFLILYVCALNSKEMAVTLPAILFVYELVFGRAGHGVQSTAHRVSRWRPAILTAVLTVPYVLGKFSSPSPLMGNDAYRLHLGLRTYFRALGHYLEIFALTPGSLNLSASILILLLLGTIAILGRRRSLLFAWLFILITLLPVAFIGLRGGYAIYVSTFGIALFLAVSIVESRKALARFLVGSDGPLAFETRRLLQFDTFVACLLVLLVFHNSRPLVDVSVEDNRLRSFAMQIAAVQPKIDSTRRILFLDDPFPIEDTAPLSWLRLHYRAPELVVDRIKGMLQMPDRNEIDSYDCIFTFNEARLVRVKP